MAWIISKSHIPIIDLRILVCLSPQEEMVMKENALECWKDDWLCIIPISSYASKHSAARRWSWDHGVWDHSSRLRLLPQEKHLSVTAMVKQTAFLYTLTSQCRPQRSYNWIEKHPAVLKNMSKHFKPMSSSCLVPRNDHFCLEQLNILHLYQVEGEGGEEPSPRADLALEALDGRLRFSFPFAMRPYQRSTTLSQ